MNCRPRKACDGRGLSTRIWRSRAAQPRFLPFATVPLQDGQAAAEVLREAHADDFKGAMIGTQPKGKGGVLDDPALKPFWRAADELGSVIFIHPVFESGDDRVNDYGMANAVGRITDTLIASQPVDLCRPRHALRQRQDHYWHWRRGAALRDRPTATEL